MTGTEGRSGNIETGRFASGPPLNGGVQTRGYYVRQDGGANGTWRWLEDQPTPGTTSPTTFVLLEEYQGLLAATLPD